MKRLVREQDAAIHSDDEFDAIRFLKIQRVGIETIAFIEPIWDVAAHVRAESFQCLHHQSGGGDTIHIVIAVDRDRLIVVQRMLDTVHGGLHAGELKRIKRI